MRVESFVFYTSWLESIEQLSNEQDKLESLLAIMRYQAYHEEPDKPGVSKAMFTMAKPVADELYNRRMANLENGKKGGRPTKVAQSAETEDKANGNPDTTQTKPNETQVKPKITQVKPNPNLYENDNDNENENVDYIDNSNELFAPSSNENDAVAKIPLNKNGTFHLIFPSDIEYYKSLYPAVDVEQEIRTMVGWCDANPSNRKTKSGVKRFIANWLSRAQNHTRAYSERNKSGVNYIDIE